MISLARSNYWIITASVVRGDLVFIVNINAFIFNSHALYRDASHLLWQKEYIAHIVHPKNDDVCPHTVRFGSMDDTAGASYRWCC